MKCWSPTKKQATIKTTFAALYDEMEDEAFRRELRVNAYSHERKRIATASRLTKTTDPRDIEDLLLQIEESKEGKNKDKKWRSQPREWRRRKHIQREKEKVNVHYLLGAQNGFAQGPTSVKSEKDRAYHAPTTNFGFFHAACPETL